MTDIVNLKLTRKEIACGCGKCDCPHFSIVDDFGEGHIVICDNCGSVNGKLINEDKNDNQRKT